MLSNTPQIILGVDPGVERVGVAIVSKQEGRDFLVYSDCIRTAATLPLHQRAAHIGSEIARLVAEFSPTILSIEKLYFNTNQKTAMAVAEVRGVIIYEATRHGLVIDEFTPLEIKVAVTGYGRSEKRQVQEMVKKLVHFDKKKAVDDEFDAIAIALTSIAHHRHTQ
jgi:crossover junction endodeoxyribonuclease RuvC